MSLDIFTNNIKHTFNNAMNPEKAVGSEVPSEHYNDVRHTFKTGDVMAVGVGTGVSVLDKIFGWGISKVTGYDVYHVGTIIRLGDRLFVLEAIFPVIRLSLLSTRLPFYHIGVAKDLNLTKNEEEDFITTALSHLGTEYSMGDVFKSYFYNTVSAKNGYQCVELTRKLIKKATGYNYTNEVLIPGSFVKQLKTHFLTRSIT